jgi:SAM-dependent methyltransferase
VREVVYRQYAEAFDTHWWADHRRRVVTRWLELAGVRPDGSHPVLEIGSGAGTDHAYWHQFGPVTGVEISKTGLAYCQGRGYAELIEGDLNHLELPHERFDLAVDFHVLYHEWVKDPAAVLGRMRQALKPGGYLVMSEPAFELLRRGHDEAVMAARRWTRGGLVELVKSAGFEVERCTGYLTLLLPAVLLSLLLDKLRPSAHEVDEIKRPSALVDGVLRAIMSVERFLMRLFPLPAGTSWLLLARRAKS